MSILGLYITSLKFSIHLALDHLVRFNANISRPSIENQY